MDLQFIAQAYLPVLEDIERHFLDQSQKDTPAFAKLSGLFLPSAPEGYSSAKQRIMVVGRETRAWNVVSDKTPFTTLGAYVERSLTKHQKFLAKHLEIPKDSGASFFNFLRLVSDCCGSKGVVWANLFCFSWAGNSPQKCPQFPIIRQFSERLLKRQIEIFAPDTIIFANGASSAPIRQAFFPHKGEHCVCSDFGDYAEEGIPKNQLWRFRLNEQIQCYRIQHPSSRSQGARNARKFLIDELLSK